jgi:hypothetical protein
MLQLLLLERYEMQGTILKMVHEMIEAVLKKTSCTTGVKNRQERFMGKKMQGRNNITKLARIRACQVEENAKQLQQRMFSNYEET